jgi:hypothetical protein
MNQSTAICRRVFLIGLTIHMLMPDARAADQEAAIPTQLGRAPFGLTWRMSIDEVSSLIQEDFRYRTNPQISEFIGTYLVCHKGYLPRVPRDASRVTLSFGHRNQLIGVYAEGESGEAYTVTERYTKLSSLLSEIYGPGSETITAQSWFRNPPANDLLRNTTFNTNEVQVKLSLLTGYLAGSKEAAYWIIDYKNRAGFAEFNADHRKDEKDAL